MYEYFFFVSTSVGLLSGLMAGVVRPSNGGNVDCRSPEVAQLGSGSLVCWEHFRLYRNRRANARTPPRPIPRFLFGFS